MKKSKNYLNRRKKKGIYARGVKIILEALNMHYWEHHNMANKNKEFRKKSFGICMKCTYGGLVDND